jgi:hypothetical protein
MQVEVRMRPVPKISVAKITPKDVLELTGTEYVIDGLWVKEFGREIEYRYRPIPYQLMYLILKYGPVIKSEFFIDSIMEICGTIENDPDTNELTRKNLAENAARRLIEEAVRGGSGFLHRCNEWSFCLMAARMAAEQERR